MRKDATSIEAVNGYLFRRSSEGLRGSPNLNVEAIGRLNALASLPVLFKAKF